MFTVKNLVFYYAVILFPLLVIILVTRVGIIDNLLFAILLFTYVSIYRPLVDGIRLIKLGIIRRSELAWNFIPFWNIRYKKYLYSNRI